MFRTAPGWGLLFQELATTRRSLVRLLAWSGVEALPPLVSGLFVSAAVDQGFLAGRPGVGLAWLGGFGVAMALRAYAARAGFPHLAGVVEPLRDSLVERVVRSALARPSADPAEVARLTEQVESARQLTATLLRTLRGVGVTLIAALVGLALLAPAVLPLVLLPLLAAGVLFVRLLRPMVARRRAVVLAEERLAAEAGRALRGLRDVQASGTGQEVALALAEAARESAAASRALGRASALRALVVALGGRLPVLAVLAAAPWLLAHDALTAGELLGVATYLLQQLDPAVRTLAGTVGGWLLNLAVVLDRLAAVTAPEPRRPSAAEPSDAPAGEVRLAGVRYAHGAGATPVLDGLDAVFRAGEHVAVVGVSGAGKSTLAGLLAGVAAPTAGAVVVGGGAHVALLPQEAYVFPGPVRENLAWLAPEATDRRLAEAVEHLGADELVARLGGLGGALRDPGELSAGERQLLALVRTYVSAAPVVVLDEATCHLDAAAEERVERAFAARPGTLVVIAHRISSALRAERVLLLDGGRGMLARHGDLQVLSPLYRELVGRWLGSTPRNPAPNSAPPNKPNNTTSNGPKPHGPTPPGTTGLAS
ncbi:ABC transporter ATP-binding protein [Kitasatospora sp. SUK 42]|uniref:ATP-binding cassette domain-containing protein n=1 Tax=Kitasatospora sp. SUK 42 TaxID=1588882 RepID=UPI001C31E8CB|nr:ABC transporter ATP-binding protein [Kitasatospora sp. SUK 42]MBV2153753.1 ABC transporter ATP-binding protein/permease [Kitasatospora sp. SUK 42]